MNFDNRLLGVVQALAASKDGPTLVALLARSARSLIGSDGATVVAREANRCRYLEEDAIGALWKGQDFPLEDCISGWCITTGEAAVIPDIRADSRIPQALYANTFIRGMAMAPIRRERPIGALGVYWATRHEASDAELQALWALADSAALALQNVRLIEKLRRDNERKDAFLTSLAHELSESLGPMRTSLHMRQTSGDQKAQARANEILEAQLGRQAQLVETLVESGELLTGRAALRARRLDLRDVVSEVVQSRQKDADEAEVDLTHELPAQATVVTGERRRLEQALHRALDNSLRCTPAGGHVAVTLAVEEDQALLSVRDSGVGIDPAALPHLFEPFFKPQDEPARSLSGLGLGLSLVSSIIQLHGGSVTLTSEGCGRGALLELRLPLDLLPSRNDQGIAEVESPRSP